MTGQYSRKARRPRAARRSTSRTVARVVEHLARVPVVDRLVVVPLAEHGHLGVEAPDVHVLEVVAVVAAELGERLGHLRLLRDHDVAPHGPVGQGDGLGDRAVGVDRVARVDEEVGGEGAPGLVGAHATARRVDAPALAGGVPAPGEGHVGPGGRGGAQPAHGRLAAPLGPGDVLEDHAVEDVLARGQPAQRHARRQVRALRGERAAHPARAGEGLRGRPLHDHAGLAVGPRPHHAARRRDLAALHAVGDERQRALGRQGAWAAHGGRRPRKGRAQRGGAAPHEERATGQAVLGRHGASSVGWRGGLPIRPARRVNGA